MVNRKAKGTNAERELIHLLHQHGWAAIRTAGSGSSSFPAPDILAGNALRRIAIECKTTKGHKRYFHQDDLNQLQTFARNFGAESWIGMRFPGEPWYFVMLEDLEQTPGGWAISLELAQRKGLRIEELSARQQVEPGPI